MELRFKDSALADVRTFVANYEEAFFDLYSDTGIWSEDTIIENVRASARALFDDLYDALEAGLSGTRVLGRKKGGRGWQELRLRVKTRLVIVYYSENTKDHTRWVESIFIDRKPIIF